MEPLDAGDDDDPRLDAEVAGVGAKVADLAECPVPLVAGFGYALKRLAGLLLRLVGSVLCRPRCVAWSSSPVLVSHSFKNDILCTGSGVLSLAEVVLGGSGERGGYVWSVPLIA